MKKITVKTYGIIITALGVFVVFSGLFFPEDSTTVMGGGIVLVIMGLSVVLMGQTVEDDNVMFENCTFNINIKVK